MIELEERGSVTILHMKRGKGNALNVAFAEVLVEALDRLDKSPTRAVVLTGQGSVFGAGVDLLELLEGGAAKVREFLPRLGAAFERIATYPKPLVAAVNGHALAGGAILMLASDQRILARGKARIGLTEIQVGVIFPAWPLEIARHTTPPEHFQSLILGGRTYLPDAALARGLVDELVEPEQLLDRACEVATELGAVPTPVFTATKLAIRRPMLEAARTQSTLTDAAILEHWCSAETLAGIAEFARRNIKAQS